MLSAFASAFKTPELRKKIFFTLGILLVFRLGSTIPASHYVTVGVALALVAVLSRIGVVS